MSEEVLNSVSSVKHKKVDGVLYLMAQRLAWMPNHKSVFTVSHPYAMIKCQRISAEGKSKIQLQVMMHDGAASTFHFCHSDGADAQRKDRDVVKDALMTLLPKFRTQISKELQQKNVVLQKDPELLSLYKDLVVGEVISADEFWTNFASKRNMETNQSVGVSPSFLADIRPESDGVNGLKYNLTVETIQAIFQTYPNVAKKHKELVPHEMTDAEFWAKFFQSHYYQRDRLLKSGNKDIFFDCAVSDESTMKQEAEKGSKNPLVDLNNMSDADFVDEGYGVNERQSGSNAANQSLIRRLNHHSTMIMRLANQETSGEPFEKRKRLQEATTYEDLSDEETHEDLAIHISDFHNYLQGSKAVAEPRARGTVSFQHAKESMQQQILNLNMLSCLTSANAAAVLGELSNASGVRVSDKEDDEKFNSEVVKDLNELYTSAIELLRHFWACFPVINVGLEEKLEKMQETLHRFSTMKVHPVKQKYLNSNQATTHIEEMLQVAQNKYLQWKQKRVIR